MRSGVGRRGSGVAQEVCICGAQSRLEGGKLEVMLSKAFEEGANRLDMRYRIGIEHNPTSGAGRRTDTARRASGDATASSPISWTLIP